MEEGGEGEEGIGTWEGGPRRVLQKMTPLLSFPQFHSGISIIVLDLSYYIRSFFFLNYLVMIGLFKKILY